MKKKLPKIQWNTFKMDEYKEMVNYFEYKGKIIETRTICLGYPIKLKLDNRSI